jgi:hypothetical protein
LHGGLPKIKKPPYGWRWDLWGDETLLPVIDPCFHSARR